ALKRARLNTLGAPATFTFQELDLVNRDATADLFATPFDTVVHLAAQAGVRYSLSNPHAYADANLVGFLNVLEGCRNGRAAHLIFASSSSVYGAGAATPFSVHGAADHPVSLYAATKRANELMAHAYSHLYRLPATGLRFFTVYGPWGRPDMAYFSFTKAILAGESIDLYHQGDAARDFTYIDDVVESIARLINLPATPDPAWSSTAPDPATSNAPYRLYNVGNADPIPLRRLVSALEDAIGLKANVRLKPAQPGDVPVTSADASDFY
ncbi:MAG: NAD-dependent epimerase/dehydratase family protein, partial [Chloroflexota bacterium]|nr:NAD-dependent epimerase/dehydratase family protein [Chloroflexota bacterium]